MGIISFVESVCVQTAVYWGSPTADGFGGITYADPVELTPEDGTGVRWEEKAELITDNKGREIVSKAQIMTNADLEPEGYLYLGHLSDLTNEQKADPRKVPDSWEIKRTDNTPLFRSTDEFVKMVYL